MTLDTRTTDDPPTHAERNRTAAVPERESDGRRGDVLVVCFFLVSFAVTCLFCVASAIAQVWG